MKDSGSTPTLAAAPRILVPVDFSRSSEHALHRAAYVGAIARADLHVLHVLPPESRPADRKNAERGLAHARAVLRRAAGNAGRGGRRVTIDSHVHVGKPHVHIIRLAREIGAELVIVGRGRRAGALGTTANRLVHMSDVATLLVGRLPNGPYRRPLVAVDIDPSARSLIELVCRVVGNLEVPMRIVHAYHVPFARMHKVAADDSVGFYTRAARESARRELEKMLARLGSSGCAVELVVRRGDPRTVIAREAARRHADLVGVGTHGRSGVAYALLGSMAEWVVANVTRDVLVSRPVRFTFVSP